MDKVFDLYSKFKYKWIILFILFFPFMKISYFRTVELLVPVYSVFRWVFTGILFIVFIYKKKKPSKLLISFFALEMWIFIICAFKNSSQLYDCIKDVLSVLSIGLFIEDFIDDKKDMILALMLNFEIAIYPNLFTIIRSLNVEEFRGVVQFLGYYNLLILYVFPAILIAFLYNALFKNKIRGYLLIAASIISVFLSRASTPLMALLMTIVIYFALSLINKISKIKNISVILGTVGLFLNLFVVFIYSGGRFKIIDYIIENVLKRDTSFTGRTSLWLDALKIIKDSSIVGNGFNIGVTAGETLNMHPHNDMLNRLIVSGIVGLMMFIFCNYVLLRKIDNTNNSKYKYLVISLLFGIFLTFITESYVNVYLFYIVYFLGFNLEQIIEKEQK